MMALPSSSNIDSGPSDKVTRRCGDQKGAISAVVNVQVDQVARVEGVIAIRTRVAVRPRIEMPVGGRTGVAFAGLVNMDRMEARLKAAPNSHEDIDELYPLGRRALYQQDRPDAGSPRIVARAENGTGGLRLRFRRFFPAVLPARMLRPRLQARASLRPPSLDTFRYPRMA